MESMDRKLSLNGLRMFLRHLDRNLWFSVVASFFAKIAENDKKIHFLLIFTKFQKILNCDDFFYAPPSFFTLFPRTSMKHKIITRGRKNILKPDFESSRRELSFYDNRINKIQFLMPFCNPNGMDALQNGNQHLAQNGPFELQKGMKYENKIRNRKSGP